MTATTWRKLAACRGLDVEAFYPVTEDEADAAEAKAVCADLPGSTGVPGARAGPPRA